MLYALHCCFEPFLLDLVHSVSDSNDNRPMDAYDTASTSIDSSSKMRSNLSFIYRDHFIDQTLPEEMKRIIWMNRVGTYVADLQGVLVGVSRVGRGLLGTLSSSIQTGSNTSTDTTSSDAPKSNLHHQPPLKETFKRKERQKIFNERRIPSGPLERTLQFGGIAASMVVGAASDAISSTMSPLFYGQSSPLPSKPTLDTSKETKPSEKDEMGNSMRKHAWSTLVTEKNAERLASGLCRMRGAALKVGQMLSLQDESLIPPQVQEVLRRVRDGADVMPISQLAQMIEKQLGSDWKSKVGDFEYTPIGAASIGQVHKVTLLDGTVAAMKIQYPGVAKSIESDINSVKRLIQITNMFPKGLFIDHVMKVAKDELSRECDYELEAANQERFRRLILSSDQRELFNVPHVFHELTTKQILTTEFVDAIPVNELAEASQETRDRIGERMLNLCLMELFEWRFMQTDPNWGNFLYEPERDIIHLIDFGSCLELRKEFVDDYIQMVYACAGRDRETVLGLAIKLGFLTGDESQKIIDAHIEAAFMVGEPFASDEPYDFGKGQLTKRLADLSASMVTERLTPPPVEAYTLHRKLSGAFLTCIKLKCKIPCRPSFMHIYDKYN